MSEPGRPGEGYPPTPAGRVLIAAMVLLTAAGALGWTWTGDWRLGVTAVVLVFVHASVAAVVDSPRARLRRYGKICNKCWTHLHDRPTTS